MNIKNHLLILAWCMLLVVGCSRSSSFENEFALVVRAGRGKLNAQEREELQRQRHILSVQLADASTAQLIRLFAGLSDAMHQELLKKSYLKWKYAQLDENRQQVFRSLVQVNVDLAKKRGSRPQPGFSIEALATAEVGFALVLLPESQQKVVSVFILWPKLTAPTWVTVVNALWCGSPNYFTGHLQTLPKLRSRPTSTIPEKKL